MIRTTPIRSSYRRPMPPRPQPQHGPKYVAVALAGVFAIVPAGLAEPLPSVKLPQETRAGARMMDPCDCP